MKERPRSPTLSQRRGPGRRGALALAHVEWVRFLPIMSTRRSAASDGSSRQRFLTWCFDDETQGPLRSSCTRSAREDVGLLDGFEADAGVETARCWVVRFEADLDAHCASFSKQVDTGGE